MTAAKRTAPISSHPAFKWGVGAWFALLLGLGLFVMPAAIHQMLAEQLGLAGLLGDVTAMRAALSFAAALFGLAIGLILALRVAAINELDGDDDEEDDDRADLDAATPAGPTVWLDDAADRIRPAPATRDAPRRPFNPREDLAEPGIASVEEPAGAAAPDDEPRAPEIVVEEFETAPSDPYFVEQWEEPMIEADTVEVWDEVFEPSSLAELSDADMLPVVPEDMGEGSVEDTAAATPAAPAVAEPPPPPAAALGDLSLEALTERLGTALAAFKAGPPEDDDPDPVIAFLRREAERENPGQGPDKGSGDPQADLRNALDKLSRVAKPK